MGTEPPLVWYDTPLAHKAVLRLAKLHAAQPGWPWFRKQQQWLRGQSLFTKIVIPTLAFLAAWGLELWAVLAILAVLCLALYGPSAWHWWQLRTLMRQLRSGQGVGHVLVEGDAGWDVLADELQVQGASLEDLTVDRITQVDTIIYHYAVDTTQERWALRRKRRYADDDPDLKALRERAAEAAGKIVAAMQS